jgi:hypothetical protein
MEEALNRGLLVEVDVELCAVIDMRCRWALHIVTPEQVRALEQVSTGLLPIQKRRAPLVELWLRPHHLLQFMSDHLLPGRSLRPLAGALPRLGHAE